MTKPNDLETQAFAMYDVSRREALRTLAAGAALLASSPASAGSAVAQDLSRRQEATVALVGGTHIHAPSFAETMAEMDGITTKYVWDPDADTAQRRQEVTGGEIVEERSAIYEDPEVDGVVICSETFRHAELVPEAARAGKHVFAEKPLGLNGEEATEIARAVSEAGVLFQTGYFMRSDGRNQLARRLIQDGTLGEVTRLRLSNCHSGALDGWFDDEWRWMTDLEQAGVGGFGDLGAHVIDLLLWFMEDDEVEGCTGHIDQVLGRYGETDEYGEGIVRFASGAVATIAAGWVDRANPNALEVSGTEGHLRITQNELYLTSPDIDEADGSTPWTDLPEDWPHAFDLFLHALRGEEDVPLITPDEAARANRVVSAIYRAAEEERWTRP